MGNAVAIMGAQTVGHGAFPPTVNTGSGNSILFVDGQAALVMGDPFGPHCDPTPVCHPGQASEGSSVLFINGQAAAREGDGISCGDSIAPGGQALLFAD